jgi:uncharacterized protein YyaL (SSP411 family)
MLLSKEQEEFSLMRYKLFESRSKRIRPLTDDKALLSWNALFNWSLVKAGKVLQNNLYLDVAEANMNAIIDLFNIAGTPGHVYKNGQLKHQINLDDYVFLSRALLELNNATGKQKWMDWAKELLQRIDLLFYNQDQKSYYFSAAQNTDVLVPKLDEYDGSLPSSNAVLTEVLMVLGISYKNSEWIAKADSLLAQIKAKAIRNPYAYAYWNLVALREHQGYQVITCTKKQFEKVKSCYQSAFQYFKIEEQEEVKKDAFLLICNKESCDKVDFPLGDF